MRPKSRNLPLAFLASRRLMGGYHHAAEVYELAAKWRVPWSQSPAFPYDATQHATQGSRASVKLTPLSELSSSSRIVSVLSGIQFAYRRYVFRPAPSKILDLDSHRFQFRTGGLISSIVVLSDVERGLLDTTRQRYGSNGGICPHRLSLFHQR